jgi:hypothetical protein
VSPLVALHLPGQRDLIGMKSALKKSLASTRQHCCDALAIAQIDTDAMKL